MKEFKKHLDDASKIVQTWPAWKQEILGGKAVTTLQRLEKELLILKNNLRQHQEQLLSDPHYYWLQHQVALKREAINRHKRQLEESK